MHTALLYRFLLAAAGSLAITACSNSSHKTYKNQIATLTGGAAKYWDLIYATDIYGRYQNPIDKLGKSSGCVKFEASGKVTHLINVDSLTVRENDCDSDVISNPDHFVFESDSTIHFIGRTFTIDAISKDIMVLKFGPDKNRKATAIYRASKLQNKKFLKCKSNVQ